MDHQTFIIRPDDRILVTGSTGFIGHRLVRQLLEYGFQNVRCFVRPSASPERLQALRAYDDCARLEFAYGNLLSREDCAAACEDVAVVFHLAAGSGEKSYPDAFLNSVVTTRNLIEASAQSARLVRFVNVSSFAVYSNRKNSGGLLDESCPVEDHPEERGDAYCFAKAKQDEIVRECGELLRVPYVIVRPGYVYGPGKEGIGGRVGIDTFGLFLHLGGGNTIPLTYVDNCADAIALAGLRKGVEGEVFNVVDDDLPSSGRFLRLYKQHVRKFRTIYVPHVVSYLLCHLWEYYSIRSNGQLPPAYNRARWHATWKSTKYSNLKAKRQLGWNPTVPTDIALERFFAACRNKEQHA